MQNEKEYVKLTGSVENVVFSNRDTGFTVLELSAGEELVCVVGALFDVEPGEELMLTGYYDTHKTYGMQFRAQMCERKLPATANAIVKYLSSGIVKGIGAATARRIVDKFGSDTFEIIEKNPHRLTEVTGITKGKSQKLAVEFKQAFGIRSLMSFLSEHNIGAMQSVTIYKKWGTLALDLIKQNPYMLVSFDFIIDFEVVDKMGEGLGFDLDNPSRVGAALQYILVKNTQNGHTCIPRETLVKTASTQLLSLDLELINDILEQLIIENQLYSFTSNREYIFLPVFFLAQQYITSRLGLMLKVYTDRTDNVLQRLAMIEKQKNIEYESLQRKAIEQSVNNDIFILTGGPGTGKTTALNGIIEIFEQLDKTVAIAAPTGRAAKRISEVTNREAKTIHRLLGVEMGYSKNEKLEFVHNEQNPLDSDVIIIDEMSMIDTLLFDALLKGIKPTAKLIMVGDFHQLPSVGAGNILRDLIESDTIPMVELTHIFRQAAQSLIITNAHAIVQGELPDLTRNDKDFFFMPENDSDKAAETILDLCSYRLPNTYKLSPFEEIQVLCPQRNGALGVIELNKKLQNRLNKKLPNTPEFTSGLYTFRSGDKVMQIRNNYDIEWQKDEEHGTGIFNGDIGIIKMIDKGSSTLSIDFDSRLAFYTFDMALELELAYAVTVHKSQGSEFEAIILPIMGGYDKLYFRNLLYTAVTRAKRILVIIGSKSRVTFMVNNNHRMLRYTCLKAMLQESIFNKGS